MSDERIEIEVYVLDETDAAYLVSENGTRDEAVWVPKAQCDWNPDYHLLELPERLALEKGLI